MTSASLLGWPVVSPILVGRAAHLAALDSCLDRANAGSGRIVLVSGEAGIGKSRLAGDVKAQALGRGMRVLEGSCFETDRALPFAPMADVLRSLFTTDTPPIQMVGRLPNGGDLVPLLPELEPHVPAVSPLEGQAGKHRLFHTLGGLFTALAIERPLLLVVEDVHWADEASTEFIRHFARGLASLPIMVLLTFRADEGQPALRSLLVGLDRQRLGAELELEALTADEIESMLRSILGPAGPGHREFVDLVADLSEGNPFFVEEILRSLIARGEISFESSHWKRKPVRELHVPRTVREAVAQRTAQLSPPAVDALNLAAIVGRRFGFELLRALLGADEADLLAWIKELVAAGLVVEASADELAFRHALTREAVYGSLLARERRGLHRRIAHTIEALHTGDPDTLDDHLDLAYHWYTAGVWDKALDFGQRAGERALAVYAPRVAVDQLSRALEAAQHLGVAAPPEALRQRGLAYELVGEFDLARADLELAVQTASEHSEGHLEWQTLLDLGALWAGRDYTRTGDYVTRALELARRLDNSASVAHSLNRLGNWHMNVEDIAQAMARHDEALAIFEELGDQTGVAETLDLLGLVSHEAARPEKAAAYYERAIPLLRELDDRQRLINALVLRTMVTGSYALDLTAPELAGANDGASALRMAHEIGWRAGEAFASWELSLWHGARGAYDRALDLAHTALTIAEEIGHTQWLTGAHYSLASVFLDLLDLPRARAHAEQMLQLAHATGSRVWVRTAASVVASAAIGQRDLDAAAAALAETPVSNVAGDTMGLRQCRLAHAQLCLARKKPQDALEVLTRHFEGTGSASPRVLKLRGDALLALGRHAEAEEVLRLALGAAGASHARWLIWRTQVSLGRLHAGQRSGTAADQAFAAAHAEIQDLARAVPDVALRETFVNAALDSIPGPRPAGERRLAKERFGGLTAREREVAALVAQGLSNRAIAERLIVGERTVETYVSSVLNKLGYTSRAQIAAWAVDKGLVKPT